MDDYISRQAAIDAVRHAWAKGLEPSQYIEDLPPAQTEKRTEERTETHGVCLDAIDRQAAKRMTERNVGLRNATNDKKAWSE